MNSTTMNRVKSNFLTSDFPNQRKDSGKKSTITLGGLLFSKNAAKCYNYFRINSRSISRWLAADCRMLTLAVLRQIRRKDYLVHFFGFYTFV
jgi:hypothetical protein